MSGKSVFVAGPFKGMINADSGEVSASSREWFEGLMAHLERAGWVVHNAHRREAWGSQMLQPQECTRIDFQEISASDLLVAIPGPPMSPGTHVELGWASALQKPIVVVTDDIEAEAFLVRGLSSLTRVEVVSRTSPSLHAEVMAAANRLLDVSTAEMNA